VYLDGEYAFNLDPYVALEAGLKPGQQFDMPQLQNLEKRNLFRKALSCADRLLSFRPRSEKELRQKLMQKGFSAGVISEAMDYLKEKKLVDDEAFARYWAENRAAFNPRSRRMVQLELRQKGIAVKLAEETSEIMDEEAAAYQAGVKKASHLTGEEYDGFRRKLGEFLRRRGFGYDVIDRSVKRLWEEYAHKE
jgi:regulatory protein